MEEYLKQFRTEDLEKMLDECKKWKYVKTLDKDLYTFEEYEKIETIQKILINRVLTNKKVKK